MADEKRMPHDAEARAFKTAVLQAAATWLESKPHLNRSNFNVDVIVMHTAQASEDLSDYFQRDTGDEAK
jgi:Holliday junction resolvase-like predicted endonuclease